MWQSQDSNLDLTPTLDSVVLAQELQPLVWSATGLEKTVFGSPEVERGEPKVERARRGSRL
jgi:hypothetical protein